MKYIDNKRYVRVPHWQPNMYYYEDNLVQNDDKLYICLGNHISSASFADDMTSGYEKWKLAASGGSGGAVGSYQQINKLDVIAPLLVEVPIEYTVTFAFPSLEILKFEDGLEDATIDEFIMNSGDGTRFYVDGQSAELSRYVKFDGKVQLATEYEYEMLNQTYLVTGYSTVSEVIDFTKFSGVDSLEVVDQ